MKLSEQANASGFAYNIAVGNPEFLQEYWMRPDRREMLSKACEHSVTIPSLSYDFSPGRAELIQLLKHLHYREHNILDIEDRHIVLGNGATQILNALFLVYRDRGVETINAGTGPYFPVFKGMAENSGLSFLNEEGTLFLEEKRIITSPNNPDGSVPALDSNCILDLSYMWKTYFRSMDTMPSLAGFKNSPMVFSMSKAFGLASNRLGWVIVDDAGLAKDLEEKIELMTGQVSYEAQQRAIAVVRHELSQTPDKSLFTYGQQELERRWLVIENNTRLCLNTTFLSKRGMFLLVRDKGSGIQQSLDARGIEGGHFGLFNTDIRFNIGCSSKIFYEVFTDQLSQ